MLGEKMNISTNANYGPNFKALYVEKAGMGETASCLAESIARQIDYLDCMEKLDNQGIDTIIIKDPKNSEDRAMVAFIDSKNRLFKIGKRDHIKTNKSYDLKSRSMVYDENLETVIKAANDIANGKLTKKTSKMTQTLAAILKEIPIRSNSFDGMEPLSDIGIDFTV